MEENINPQALSPEESQEAYHEMAKPHPKDILELLVKAEAEVVVFQPVCPKSADFRDAVQS